MQQIRAILTEPEGRVGMGEDGGGVGGGSDKTSCEPSSIDTGAAVKKQADVMEARREAEGEQRRQMSRENLAKTSKKERHTSKTMKAETGDGGQTTGRKEAET